MDQEADQLFADIPLTFEAGRYHSWVINRNSINKELNITAIDDSDNIMAISHVSKPHYGIQFHPESIMTPYGRKIVSNWINIVNKRKGIDH